MFDELHFFLLSIIFFLVGYISYCNIYVNNKIIYDIKSNSDIFPNNTYLQDKPIIAYKMVYRSRNSSL